MFIKRKPEERLRVFLYICVKQVVKAFFHFFAVVVFKLKDDAFRGVSLEETVAVGKNERQIHMPAEAQSV